MRKLPIASLKPFCVTTPEHSCLCGDLNASCGIATLSPSSCKFTEQLGNPFGVAAMLNPILPIYVSILNALAWYYTLTRWQLGNLCCPGKDKSGRRMRGYLQDLLQAHAIQKSNGLVVFPDRNGAPMPVYSIKPLGVELLETELKQDFSWVCTQTPNWQHLHHWVRCSDWHIALDQAIAAQAEGKQDVQCEAYINEWDLLDANEKEPEKRFRLFKLLRQIPRLVCSPDGGMLMSYRGHFKMYFLELDRNTTGINQLAASKTPGYAMMAEKQVHHQYFPNLEVWKEFSVILVAPSASRRDALRRAIGKKDGAKYWRFICWDDVTPKKLLFESVLWTCDGEKPEPWFKREEGGK